MSLDIRDLQFAYPGDRRSVLRGLSMKVPDGEIYSLLGTSGSGKTTILNLIAGFLEPGSGTISINGRDVSRSRAEKRNIGMVFQDYALFPHMTVASNITFGLRTRNVAKKVIRKKLEEVIELTGLAGSELKMPSDLSGGERQRVALSRALVYNPELILLDEPLSALDASLREGLRRELRRILKDSGTTALYVTHDQTEAVSISDRVGFLLGGRIHEEGRPEDMYLRPVKYETAEFMGMTNILPVLASGNGALSTHIGEIPWKEKAPSLIGFRPETLRLAGAEGCILIGSRVKSIEYRGRDTMIVAIAGGRELKCIVQGETDLNIGQTIRLYLDPDEIIPLSRRSI
ncbi:MAG: ABC transporter ATP-binding protein [Thermoplasmatota archaeon]